VDAPDVEYARSGELSIAYQVLGDGPIDLVFVPFSLSAIFSAQHPPFSTFYERLASFSRLILFDKRGIGASDRPRTPPTLEAQMDDVRAVLDAAGSEQAALFGSGHGGQMCALFAATYPERTSALVLYVPWPSRLRGAPEDHRRIIRRVQEETGRSEAMERMVHEQYPSLAGDEEFLSAFTSIVRASVSPGAMAEFMRTVVEADLSDVWSTIRVPTLVLYRKETVTPETAVARGMAGAREVEEDAKAVAAAIPNAHAIGVAGRDYAPFVGDEIPDEVERFLSAPLAESIPERVLATVLFTDIVGSTERAASLGDRAWGNVPSPRTARMCDASWRGLPESSSTLPATASSRASTAPPAVSRARRRLSALRRRRGWRSVPACIPVSASGRVRSSRGSRCTSAPVSPRSPSPARCSCHAR